MSGLVDVGGTIVVEGSERAIENAALRVVGRTGTLEFNILAWHPQQ
jgi:hypothetical protein